MSIAIFPGSFDVFHDGHMFILKKALLFFSKDYPNYFDSMQVKDIIEDLHY